MRTLLTLALLAASVTALAQSHEHAGRRGRAKAVTASVTRR